MSKKMTTDFRTLRSLKIHTNDYCKRQTNLVADLIEISCFTATAFIDQLQDWTLKTKRKKKIQNTILNVK